MAKLIDNDELIRLYAEPGRGYTDEEMGKRFGVGRDAIFKRRKSLIEEYGDDFFIETDRGRYRIDSRTFISNIKVSWEEALILYLATRRLSRNTRLPSRPVQNALSKLATALYKPMTERLVKAAATMPELPEENRRAEILTTLIRGWSEQYKVHIRYLSLESNTPTKHTICPYLIEPSPWSDSVYVIASTNVMDGYVPFQLERIEKATLSTEPFPIDPDFDDQTLFQYAWGIWTTDKKPVDPVKLKFTGKKAIRRLGESVWHPDEKVSDPDEHGHVIWQAPIAEWREMLPWIRGWGSDVEVLEPEALRRALEREARQLAELYGVVVGDSAEQYYAHSKPNLDESEWQLLIEHLTETADLAFALGEDAGVSELAKTAGMLHDIGKYSKEFQARLRGSNRRVDHATAGAREIVKLFPDNPFAEILSYCIAGHHTGLPDYGSKGDTAEDGTLLARREKKELKNYDAYQTEIDPKLLTLSPRHLKPACFRIEEKEKAYTGFSVAFLTRMVFSTLVDADWLETERYMQGEAKPRGQHVDITTLAEQFNQFLRRFDNPQNELNCKRTETLKHCLALANHEPGFFTLTVPTGGGKTYTSMAFALNHAIEHGLKRIIYVIPFTGIIEQNANVFREALGDLGPDNILEHHSNFDWEGSRKGEDDETNNATAKLKLAAENWDIPIIVTTNVQFFESLFASKKRSARKLHNMAKSVIIFDEVQVLPRGYLKPSLLAIQELVQNYRASAVFCTATQPSLQQFFPAKKIQFTELAPDPRDLFNFYRRVQVKNLGIQTDENLISALQRHRQALCIVNTRKHAKGLFAQLSEGENFHLSTLMCPAHRQETMQKIRRRLADRHSCRVVSTQVMEAGIDLDFPVGYRAMAGLDSIIQAAGRVNREGKQTSGTMFVFTPKTDFIKRTPTFIAQTGAVAQGILQNFADDPTSIQAIEAYYRMLYTLQPEESFDAKNILGYFDKGTGNPDFDFKTAAENFKLIDDNTVAVIIPYDDEAKRLIEKLKYTTFPASVLRKLQIYTVNIYEREFMDLQSKGVILTIDEQYHVLDESWMGEEKYYHPKTGLMLPESGGGEAVFFE
jgi:CRISPR-associated endonuclease/helicase Cas3